ncbi:MAG TPA: tyrosine--tRNA ligase [Acidimicrobiales bacterium]|nr:tyrosine--tRNA ligase [Acidimicrobiales bacterium]
MSRGRRAPTFAEDLEFRRLWHQAAGAGLRERLESGAITGYIGFDPTADSLHVGHLLQLCMLRRLQSAGHKPIAVAGGGTGLIGDPGGKSEERPLLDTAQLRANIGSIRAQLEHFVDFSGGGAVLVDNADWLGSLGLVDFLRDVGKHFSVNEMIRRESVMSRLDRPEQGISFTEFSYMLLQAYDFLHLFDLYDCRLQLGGSDQYGNILMGVELVRKQRRADVYGLTSPLVLKADGTKIGKTETGTVWLDARRTSPYQLYQYFLRTEDSVVADYLRYFTFLDQDTITALDESASSHPEMRESQRELARQVSTLVHGEVETRRAEEAAGALYSQEVASLDERTLLEVCSEAPTTTFPRSDLDGDGLALVDATVRTGIASSKGAARTLVAQGGIYVNNVRQSDLDARIIRGDLLFGKYLLLRRGKQDYHLLRFE